MIYAINSVISYVYNKFINGCSIFSRPLIFKDLCSACEAEQDTKASGISPGDDLFLEVLWSNHASGLMWGRSFRATWVHMDNPMLAQLFLSSHVLSWAGYKNLDGSSRLSRLIADECMFTKGKRHHHFSSIPDWMNGVMGSPNASCHLTTPTGPNWCKMSKTSTISKWCTCKLDMARSSSWAATAGCSASLSFAKVWPTWKKSFQLPNYLEIPRLMESHWSLNTILTQPLRQFL